MPSSAILSAVDAAALAASLEVAAREAGEIARGYFRRGEKTTARIWNKAGGSPVTEADVSVDAFLKVRLSQLLPDAGWLSEETRDDPARLDRDLVWIVDPIDGTRAFLHGDPDWSVAIALLDAGRPTLGVVHAPAHDSYFEARAGGGARLNGVPIAVSAHAALGDARITGPKPMLETLARHAGPFSEMPKIPSLALRIARVAAGDVDIALVTANARDWDLAAADLVLSEAGGALSSLAGIAPVYNRPEPVHGALLAASRALHPRLVEAMRSGESDARRLARAN